MRDMGGYWQVVEASNIDELMSKTEELTRERLAELNAPIEQQIKAGLVSYCGLGSLTCAST